MSSTVSKKPKSDLIRLSVTLFAITAVIALVLAMINHVTAPKIAEIQQKKLESAMSKVMPDGKTFEDVTQKVLDSWTGNTPLVNMQVAKDDAGTVVGYCVEVSPKGYSDIIDMMVGINAAGEITGTDVIKISDTPGIGTQVVSDPAFAAQFVGKSGTLQVGGAGVTLISGATYSSTGFTNGVNAALSAYRILTEEVSA